MILRPDRARTVHGASVGILMLDTAFPRLPGDVGHAETWPFPVHYRVVRDAFPEAAVKTDAGNLKPAFIAAAKELVADGVDGLTTSCGFLSLLQADLQRAVPVPVAASSLMQLPLVSALLPEGRRPVVLTISAESLTPAHLEAAGADPSTPIGGVDPEGAFAAPILGNRPEFDPKSAAASLETALDNLLRKSPDAGAVILECTNMAPFARALSDRCGLPVYSIYSFVTWFQSGLKPRQF